MQLYVPILPFHVLPVRARCFPVCEVIVLIRAAVNHLPMISPIIKLAPTSVRYCVCVPRLIYVCVQTVRLG